MHLSQSDWITIMDCLQRIWWTHKPSPVTSECWRSSSHGHVTARTHNANPVVGHDSYSMLSVDNCFYNVYFYRFGKNAKIVHFIGSVKPWHTSYNKTTGQIDTHGDKTHRMEYLQFWWKIFTEHVQPHVNSSVVSRMLIDFILSIILICCGSQGGITWIKLIRVPVIQEGYN